MPVSFQISDKRGDAILVVKAEGPAEQADQIFAGFAAGAQVAGLDAALDAFGNLPGAIANVQAVFPTASVTAAAGPPAPWGNPPVPAYQPPPMPAAAAPAGPPARGGGKVQNGHCAHGAGSYRESKPGAPRPWTGYFCPAPKGDPNQCEPEFQR